MTPRYRRSSVRAALETIVSDRAAAAAAHDALWAVLWNRRYDDVDEPVWEPETAYSGILAFARAVDETSSFIGIDVGEAFIVFAASGGRPPIGSRVRVQAGERDQWRLAEVQPLGLGIDLRFDDHTTTTDTAWIGPLREGVERLRDLLSARRDQLAARRAQLGARSEPPALEEIWREELSALSDRIALETEYTPQEHTALARARAKGARSADEEERKIIAARKRRYSERGTDAIARFREERWPAIRDRAEAELKKYADYRTEVVRLEESLQRIRALSGRAKNAGAAFDRLEKAGFRVGGLEFDPARLDDPEYAEEVLRTIELLHAAIPQRAVSTATSFSAYRAPTAGPSVTRPRPSTGSG
jgi:hypothetical protein